MSADPVPPGDPDGTPPPLDPPVDVSTVAPGETVTTEEVVVGPSEWYQASGLARLVLPPDDRRLIAQRFFVGGASFNSLRQNDAESRRIEFKLEF